MNSSSRGISLTTVAIAVLIMAITAMFNTATANNGKQVITSIEQPQQIQNKQD